MMSGKIIPPSFYLQPTRRVARALLGKTLCVRGVDGMIQRSQIVETEAYLGILDRACHSFGGRRTPRTEPMYLAGGHAYIYFIYGMYFCLNAVTRGAGCPEAVLIRAVEPLPRVIPRHKRQLTTNGPGKLCRAYEIGRHLNGVPLFSADSPIWIETPAKIERIQIGTSARVGIDASGDARDLPLRFFIKNNPFVSRAPRPVVRFA